ncbi:tyrosine-type recombinase/integrase [Clostridium intestinale]|uniref:Integrase family protein n=1 Tax=Clostridium intestinale URNW TaxID=1294142 RepID=U2PYM0_9CLOT|nr:tyrosine-type recombinase/integrase [Clostridium intestinale]ERK31570.1 integrase family protein [Clostridium intestinale URNW]
MQGSVRKRGKTWSYYFDIGIVDGKRTKVEKGGFKTKGEASTALREAILDYETTGYVASKKITFITVALTWLEEYVKPLRKITTYNRYKELINKYLSKSIGGMNVSEINPTHIEKLLIENKSKISGSTLQGIFTLINTIMNRALKLRLIKDNPCKYVERPQREKVESDTLAANEIQILLSLLDLSDEYDYMYWMALQITLELGLRRGELAGLDWDNCDFENNILKIRNNLIYSNGHTYIDSLKTRESKRNLYISDDLKEVLKALHVKQKSDKILYGEFYKKNIFNGVEFNLIMRWKDGHYIHPMYYTNKTRKLLLKSSIDKNIRFHDLRHTNATLLLKSGVNMKIVQKRLGHSNYSTTADIYSHVDTEMQKDATKKIKKLLGGKMVAK